MRLGGEHRVNKKHADAYDDFSSIMEESKFSRFKPLIIVVLVVAAVTGGLLYAVPKLKSSERAAELQPQGIRQTAAIDDLAQFSKCLSDIEQANPAPDANDSAFYPKLIARYDARLGCYDQYPNNTMSGNRSSVERARQSAIDSAGEYKNIYLSSNTYDYKPNASQKNPTNGCDYSLSERDYLACVDNYYANNSNSSTGSTPSATTARPAPAPSQVVVDTAWCSAKKLEVDSFYASYQSIVSAIQAKRTAIGNVEQTIRQRYGGSGLTESQRQSAIAAETQKLNSELNTLLAQQSDAKLKYDTAQQQYLNKPC